MGFTTLIDHDGTPRVTLPRGELELDGVLDDDGSIPENQQMHVQRLTRGAWIVQTPTDGIRDLDDLVPGL
jgi:hypothetical protein